VFHRLSSNTLQSLLVLRVGKLQKPNHWLHCNILYLFCLTGLKSTYWRHIKIYIYFKKTLICECLHVHYCMLAVKVNDSIWRKY